ncbi:DNA polymerase kappa-like isoform X1 [Ciona intestinalis]
MDVSKKSGSNQLKPHEHPAQLTRMSLNDNKAGMQGLDKEKINKIIMDNTVGSRFYKNEQKREQQVNSRIQKMKEKLNSFTSNQIMTAKQHADEILLEVENQRDLSRTIIHIDMDAFYAAVEERDRPELKQKPMAVGGMDMLSTSNYVARKYGVRAAMPGFIAKKLCPNLIIVPTNFDKYREVSKETQEIFSEYDENFCGMSLDEAFLDITDHLQKRILYDQEERTFNYHPTLAPTTTSGDANDKKTSETFAFSAEEVAKEIRFRIHQKTLLTASAGIAANTMLAKIGSDLNKPNGQTFFVPNRDEIMKFIKDFPVRKVNGIGKVTEQLFSSLGVKKCGDIYEMRAELMLLFSATSCSFFFRMCLGCSSNILEPDGERKSISTERTFSTISDCDELFAKLDELCHSLAVDMKKQNLQGKTLTLKTKNVDFQLHTRSKTINVPMTNYQTIFPVAQELLKQEILNANNKLSLRLMGVGLSKLETATTSAQTSILKFFAGNTKPQSSDKTVSPQTSCSRDHEWSDHEPCDDNHKNGDPVNQKDMKNELIQVETSKTDTETFPCPACGTEQFKTTALLNQHLDACLSSDKTFQQPEIKSSSNSTQTSTSPCKTAISNLTNSNSSVMLDETTYSCPICCASFQSSKTTLYQFNNHVDSCLSQSTIRDILKEENGEPFKKRSLANHNNNENLSKRRKLLSKGDGIEKFFVQL